MDKIGISVQYDDREYSEALAKALLISCDSFVLSSAPFVVINEALMPVYRPVREYISRIMKAAQRKAGPAKTMENVIYTAFTAAFGGAGLSTSALAYARIASRIFKRRVGFMSFDIFFGQSLPAEDEYGVTYFSELPSEADIDELVIDISCGVDIRCKNIDCGDKPCEISSFWDILDCSERRIVVKGFDEKRYAAAEEYMKQLIASSERYFIKPETLFFENHFEEAPDPSDIHSQLGKEVLALAEKLEAEQI